MASASPGAVWIPTDVKLRWMGFLDTADLAACSQVSRSWGSLTAKSVDVEITLMTGATPPPICASAKLRLLHRLRRPLDKRNFGYLLAWAAGTRGALGVRRLLHIL